MSKIKNDGLDQYGAERFGKLTFATIRKSETERVNYSCGNYNQLRTTVKNTAS